MDPRGKVFIVTGAASGLGRATAQRLAAAGARVLAADLRPPEGEAVAGVTWARTDVTSAQSVAAAVEAALTGMGGLHGVVNCAGIAIAERTLGAKGPHDLESFERTIQVNLIGTFNVIRLAAAAIAQSEMDAEGERGVIVNTASVAAFDGQIGQAAYAASKGGVVGMTLPLAREFARHGIRVVTIAPGIFDTAMLAGLPQSARRSLGEQVPFPSRLGRPEEYADLVAQIVHNRMLNGEVIRLDGALRMGPR